MKDICEIESCSNKAEYFDELDNRICEEHMYQDMEETGNESSDYERINNEGRYNITKKSEEKDGKTELTGEDPRLTIPKIKHQMPTRFCDDCINMAIVTLADISEHHHRMCPKYKTEKFVHLFYYEDAVNAWVPAPDKIEEIISVSDQLENGEIIEIQFKRCDMTDEEIDSLPVE